ncbi:MAG: hypothetical protein HJJLKODD_01729 [Phycisphaerae bacterium]|nr:hypothetical protein [Phycisphaerae bacterium]
MNLQHITIRDVENHWESLPLALQAIARWAGVELSDRSLNAALGLLFIISSPQDETQADLAWWMTYGREAYLIETGQLFGMKIRELHTTGPNPSASATPQDHQRFKEHIRPMIREALHKNQPVLAWQGWPDYHSFLWGVITGEDHSDLGFSGTTMWNNGKSVSLANPPAKLYVIEELQPKHPGADELLHVAIQHNKAVVLNQLDPKWGVVTGLPAYRRWLVWLGEDPARHASGRYTAQAHYQMARFVTHARESAMRFIDYYKEDGRHTELLPFLEAMLADVRGVIGTLATSRDLKALEVLYRTEDGRRALAAGVDAAHDFLKAQIQIIEHMAQKLGL